MPSAMHTAYMPFFNMMSSAFAVIISESTILPRGIWPPLSSRLHSQRLPRSPILSISIYINGPSISLYGLIAAMGHVSPPLGM